MPDDLGQRHITAHELGRESALFSGIEIHAEVIDFSLEHAATVPSPQYIESSGAAQPLVARDDPRPEDEFIALKRRLKESIRV